MSVMFTKAQLISVRSISLTSTISYFRCQTDVAATTTGSELFFFESWLTVLKHLSCVIVQLLMISCHIRSKYSQRAYFMVSFEQHSSQQFPQNIMELR